MQIDWHIFAILSSNIIRGGKKMNDKKYDIEAIPGEKMVP